MLLKLDLLLNNDSRNSLTSAKFWHRCRLSFLCQKYIYYVSVCLCQMWETYVDVSFFLDPINNVICLFPIVGF